MPELAARLPLDGRSVARAWTSSDADAAGAATHGAIFWGSVKKGRSFVRNVPTCRALCIRNYCAWSAAAFSARAYAARNAVMRTGPWKLHDSRPGQNSSYLGRGLMPDESEAALDVKGGAKVRRPTIV